MTEPVIRRVAWTPLRVPLHGSIRAAHGSTAVREVLLVTVETAAGEVGIGEAAPLPSYAGGTIAEAAACLRDLAARGMGRSPQWLWDRATDETIATGGAAGAARCALETAAADILARRKEWPVARWLAAGAGWPAPDGAVAVPVQAVIDGASLGDCASEAQRLAREGFGILKLKAFGDVEGDLERLASARAAAPGAAVRVDANGAFTFERAQAFLSRGEEYGIALMEQPLAASSEDTLAETARLRRTTSVPIALDESCRRLRDVEAIIGMGAADAIVVKPMVSGLREALEMLRLAREHGVGAIVTTTFDAAVGTMAAMALAAALPEPRPVCGLATASRIAHDIATGLPTCHDGAVRIEARPGLGLTIDEDAVAALRMGPTEEVAA